VAGISGHPAVAPEEDLDLKCKHCGGPLDPDRAELGYDYCLDPECQERCLERVRLASIGVNKAADYYTTADELLPPRLPAPGPHAMEGDEADEAGASETGPARSRAPGSSGMPEKGPRSTIEKLRRAEADLDRRLDVCFERFYRGEITAVEMDRERSRLTAAFNRLVRGENIRYRSMLRRV
jgi:hypothetical protein